MIHGKVIDEQTKQPVSRAQVVFFEKNGQKALYQTESNRKGLFHAHLVARDVRYLVTAKEYVTNEEYLEYIGEKLITSTVFLTKSESVPKKIRHKILQVARNVLGVFFELSIFSSLLFQVLFISNLGFYRVVPFLVLSTFNVLVWLVYITSPRLLGK